MGLLEWIAVSFAGVPWWVGLCVALGGGLLSMFAPSYLPEKFHALGFWLGVVLICVGGLWFVANLPQAQQLAERGWPRTLTVIFGVATFISVGWWFLGSPKEQALPQETETAAKEVEGKIAVDDPKITYNIYSDPDGTWKIEITLKAKPYSDRTNTFAKFTAAGMLLAGNNISSITDIGPGEYTINFTTSLNRETLVVTPVGDTPRNFQVEVAAGSVYVKFEEPEPEIIHLRFED